MNPVMKNRLFAWLQPAVTGVGLIALWYGVKKFFGIPTFVLPAPDEILSAAWTERAVLWASALVTVRGALLGFWRRWRWAFCCRWRWDFHRGSRPRSIPTSS